MSKKMIIRFILTIVLLYFCWIGKIWAIALCLTLSVIRNELIEFITLDNLKKGEE